MKKNLIEMVAPSASPVTLITIATVWFVLVGPANGLRNKHMTANVTQTLDRLLANDRYDKRLRPGFGGPPTTISVNFFIKSIGPVSDNDQSYGLDCYFRQHWYDMRLQFEKLPGLEELSMSWLFLDRVWKPDTYFINGKKSYLHRITAPNKFLRLRHDGFITYSMRLTITAGCPMYLRRFPLDAQKCPLIVGSYGYSKSDLLYKWTKEAAIGLQEGVEIAQFDLVNITKDEEKTMMRGGLSYSVIQAHFWLKRHTGYFMLQVYIPCCLIVVCSWISFWIDPDAVPARVNLGKLTLIKWRFFPFQVYVPCGLIVLSSWVSFWIDPDDVAARVALGVTTVLSLTTMGFGGRAQMPKVSYCTALDYFVIICFTYVFSVMVEYAVVNLKDKFQKDLKKLWEIRKASAEPVAPKTIQPIDESVDVFNEEDMVQRDRSLSFPMDSFTMGKHKRGNLAKKEYLKSLNYTSVDDDCCNAFNLSFKTVVAHMTVPKERCQSLPNIQVYRSKYGVFSEGYEEKDSDDDFVDVDEKGVDVVLDVDTQASGAKETKGRKSKFFPQGFFKHFQTAFDFCRKPTESFLEDDLNRYHLDSSDKFSKLDVQSRRNFPIAFIISLVVYLLAFTYYFSDDDPGWEII